jgi:2-keto-4-pentenoate hydratase/2-oxohepta-3-ene-1,7-dioic acid hydratase in catechol pathway
MKLATFLTTDGQQRIGAVDTGKKTITDLQAAHTALFKQPSPFFNDMLALIEGGDAALKLAQDVVAKQPGDIALDSVKLLAPVPVPQQLRDCNNFEQHMRDARWGMEQLKANIAGKPVPKREDVQGQIHPVNFKQITFYISNRFSVVGPEAQVQWPVYSKWMDYEGEFGIFIGKRGRDITAANAMDHIFGYTIFNDFSARDQQAEEMEARMGPTKGKSFDSGNAMGPWIVTKDELPDYRALTVTVRVNGKVYGSNSTAGMIHSFEDIVAYISRNETLHPGEFIGSGTIGGCSGMETSQWLQDGDVVEVEVSGIGVLRNKLVRGKK